MPPGMRKREGWVPLAKSGRLVKGGGRTLNAVAEDATRDGLRHSGNEKDGSHWLQGTSPRSRCQTQNVVPEKGTKIGFGTAEARKLPTCGFSKGVTLRRQQVKPTVAASTEFVAQLRALSLVVVKSCEVCVSVLRQKEAVQLESEKLLLDSETSISRPSSSCPARFSMWWFFAVSRMGAPRLDSWRGRPCRADKLSRDKHLRLPALHPRTKRRHSFSGLAQCFRCAKAPVNVALPRVVAPDCFATDTCSRFYQALDQ